jgi:hypothetical protein
MLPGMEYQRSLFPILPEPTLKRVHRMLRRIYPELWRCLNEPFEDLQRRRRQDADFRHLNEGQLAQWLRPQIIQRAKRIFDGNPDVRFVTIQGLELLIYRDRLAIAFKKLKLRKISAIQTALQRSNYPTPTNVDFWAQARIPTYPDIPRIIVGYLPKRAFTEIAVIVAYPRATHMGFHWRYLMPDQSRKLMELSRPAEAPSLAAEKPEDKGFTVLPKKDVKESGQP